MDIYKNLSRINSEITKAPHNKLNTEEREWQSKIQRISKQIRSSSKKIRRLDIQQLVKNFQEKINK